MARRRRHSRRHSRALGMYHMRGMEGFSFDSSSIHWGAVGAGVAIGAAFAYYWLKPKAPSSNSMQGLGARMREPTEAEKKAVIARYVAAVKSGLCKSGYC